MKQLSLTLFLLISLTSFAQVNVWHSASLNDLPPSRENDERYSSPEKFDVIRMSVEDLKSELVNVPHEDQISSRNSYARFVFPMPNGELREFRVVEYDMIEAPLARKFPHLKSYIGYNEEFGSKIYFNLTTDQFFGSIREHGKTIYIDPFYRTGGSHYVSYNIKDDLDPEFRFHCDQLGNIDDEIKDVIFDSELSNKNTFGPKRGDAFNLQTYRLAVSAPFGFTSFYGGTVQGALDGITTLLNRVNAVYEREVAIRLILIGDNDQLVFTTQGDDPFNDIPTGDQAAMMNQNQTTVTTIIGSANYDIGHVFNVKANATSGQGIANLRSVCSPNNKARGASARPTPQGDAFTIAIISHEIGHQFGATHTMYHCHNVQLNTSYEPGSGTTIMSYAGICPSGTNVVNVSEDYFHTHSLEQIIDYTRSGGGGICQTPVNMGNTYPDVILDYPATTFIPINTPFRLEGGGIDAETPNDLTYCWEQYQIGNRNYENSPWNLENPQGNEPLFRSRQPDTSSTRYFPLLPVTVNGSNYLFEQLPDYERDLIFRLTVRDNAAENGGVSWDQMKIRTVDNSSAGLFEITNYQVKDTLKSGGYAEVTWNVADTDKDPINTSHVDIYMSIDGGTSFPILVKSHTPNDGSTMVNIPNETADRFRFMIVAEDNIYFDVSDRSGLLCRDSSKQAVGVTYDDMQFQACAPALIEIPINTYGIGGFDDMVSFSAIGDIPNGAVVSFTQNQAQVGTPVTMIIDFTDVVQGGSFEIGFRAESDSTEAVERLLDVELTTSNFRDLYLTNPFNGESGVDFVPTLKWLDVADAADYLIEVATDAEFNNVVFTAENVEDNQITLDMQLETGGLYFWRVQPRNNCGQYDINRISAFQIKDQACQEYCSSDPSITLSSSGMNTAEMTINTGTATPVNDLNITKVEGRHSDIGQLSITLEGPDGTQVEVFSQGICDFTNTNINMGFDDDAAGVFPTCLDFDEGIRYMPSNPLSAMNGQNGLNYKLTVQDNVSGSGGRFDGWCFEICGDIVPEKPLLVNADTIVMGIGQTRIVSSDKLQVSHSQFGSNELTITILNQTVGGTLLLDGAPIASGASFTMEDVENDRLSYRHENGEPILDFFSFIVTDPGNGFLGTPTVRFLVGGVSSTNEELPAGSELVIFPNPVSEQLVIELQSDDLKIKSFRIFDITGKLMRVSDNLNTNTTQMNVADWPKGTYILQVQSGEYVSHRKFIKQ